MGCCNRGDQYRCSHCGAAMAVTAAPRGNGEHSDDSAHCFHCGAPMQAESRGQAESRSTDAGQNRPEEQQGAEEKSRPGCC